MKLQRIVSSGICAVKDRRYITVNSKRVDKLDRCDSRYLRHLIEVSGPSVHSPKKVMQSFMRAYHNNMARLQMIDELQRPFREKSFIRKILG